MFEQMKEREMRIQRLAVLSVFLALCTAAGTLPQSAAAQPRQDPYEVLHASAEAMNNVQAARFTGKLDMQAASGGTSFTMGMNMSGEYRSPDRMRMTMDLGSLMGAMGGAGMTGPMEMIVVGDQSWMRMGTTAWEPMGSRMGASGFSASPGDFNRQIQEISRYVPNAVLTDAGSEWEIRGDLDLMAAVNEGMAMSSMMGMGMPSSSMGSLSPSDMAMIEAMTARFSTRVNKSNLLTQQMQMTMNIPEPSGSGAATVTIELVFSDYNSPSIVIEPPM
jgi:hypothetical protein